MKSLITSILLIAVCNCNLIAQNWQLFPQQDRQFYQNGNSKNVDQLCQDFSYFDGLDSIFLFNSRASNPNWQDCYDSLQLLLNYKFKFTRDGGDYFISEHTNLDYSFYFNANALVGESWSNPIIDPASPWDNYTVTFNAVNFEDVLGTMDSVRYYGISVDPPATGASAIDDVVIRVSKNHGLLNFPSFDNLAAGNACSDCFASMHLIGYIDGTDTVGVVVPKWSDYIQLQPDDKLFFESKSYYNSHLEDKSYFVNRIISVDKYADSIVVNGIQNESEISRQVYYRKAVQPLFEGFDNTIQYGIYYPGTSSLQVYYDENRYFGGLYDDLILDTLSILNTPCYSFEVLTSYAIDTLTCMVGYFSPYSYTMSTYMGCIGEKWNIPGLSTDVNLVGSEIGGHVSGTTWPVNSDGNNNGIWEILVYPNPAEYFIQLSLIPLEGDLYTIYGTDGQIKDGGNLLTTYIDITNYSKGVYILTIQRQGWTYTAHFVKI